MLFSWFFLAFQGGKSLHEGAYINQVMPFLVLILALCIIKGPRARAWQWTALGVLIIQASIQLWVFWDYRWQRDYIAPRGLAKLDKISIIAGSYSLPKSLSSDRLTISTQQTETLDEIVHLEISVNDGSLLRYRSGSNPSAQGLQILDENGNEIKTLFGEHHANWHTISIANQDTVLIRILDFGSGEEEWSAVELMKP